MRVTKAEPPDYLICGLLPNAESLCGRGGGLVQGCAHLPVLGPVRDFQIGISALGLPAWSRI